MTDPHPRSTAQRLTDVRGRLADDTDLWIATGSDDGPWLVPLSFHWTGSALLVATPRRSRTFRGAAETTSVRLALGHTRDVVMIDGVADLPDDLDEGEADAIAAAAGLDPRTDPASGWIRITPQRVQAWRTVEEIEGRTLMRDGAWVDGATPR